MGILIPLYIDPLFIPEDKLESDWDHVIYLKRTFPSVPIKIVVNPDDGPGDSMQDAYTEGIHAFRNAGVKVLGYLPTGYMNTSVEHLKKLKERWLTWYPEIDGLFLDEYPSHADSTLIRKTREAFIDARHSQLEFVVNPGTLLEIPGSVKELPFSLVISWENDRYPDAQSTLRQRDYLGHLKHPPGLGCLVLDQHVRRRILHRDVISQYQWSFVSPYSLESNPWGRLDRKGLLKQLKIQYNS